MRLSPETGKQDCRVIDFVDSQNRVAGVVSIPTLLGLDPSEIVEGKNDQLQAVSLLNITVDESLTALQARANEQRDAGIEQASGGVVPDVPTPKSVTYIDYEDPFSFVDDAFGAPHIRKMSPFAWLGLGDDTYLLECLGKGLVRVEQTTDDTGQSSSILTQTKLAQVLLQV